EQIHIIIAGDEHSPVSFKFSRKRLLISAIVGFFCACALLSTGFFTSGLFAHNTILTKKMSSAREEVEATRSANALLEERLSKMVASHEKALEDLRKENELQISRIELESNRRIAALEKMNLEQEMSFKEERDLLLSTAVSELNARSEIIENVINDIGIEIQPEQKGSQKNSGGPFVAAENSVYVYTNTSKIRARSYLGPYPPDWRSALHPGISDEWHPQETWDIRKGIYSRWQ
ncbi:MAG: hypothetical protein R6V54_15225, partial [Desulfobacteraceae bacterium]